MVEFLEEERMFAESVRRFAKEKIAPFAAEMDESQEFPDELLDLLHEQGFFRMGVPEEFGGITASFVMQCLLLEEISRYEASTAVTLTHHQAGLAPFLRYASAAQKQRILPLVGRKRHLLGYALTEPNAGSDAASLSTRAAKTPNGYTLNGSKCFITSAGLSDTYVVFTTLNPAKGKDGITAFLVDKNTAGFSVGKKENKLGFRGSPTRQLSFADAAVPAENLLGAEGDGWRIVLDSLTETRVLVAAMALGIGKGALRYAADYAKERVQFGRPIAQFQGIQFMLADMAMQVEASHALIYRVARRLDAGDDNLRPLASAAKCFASDAAMRVTTDAVQILGGYGYTKEYPVERLMRDAKGIQIFEGANQIQRIIIGRAALNGDFEKL